MTEPMFRCAHYACTLAVSCCLKRQAAQRQTATRSRKSGRMVTVIPVHKFCASGECEQGNAHAATSPAIEATIVRRSYRIGRRA